MCEAIIRENAYVGSEKRRLIMGGIKHWIPGLNREMCKIVIFSRFCKSRSILNFFTLIVGIPSIGDSVKNWN